MNEAYFWKIYFVLLHSKHNKEDSELELMKMVAIRNQEEGWTC
jgi:hypothetical protein